MGIDIFFVVVAGTLAFIGVHYYRWTVSSRRLPPGPTPIPFLGNAHQVSRALPYQTFARWGEIYGDVVYAEMFTTPTLILNSLNSVRDLLNKRSAKYSDRPKSVMFEDLFESKYILTLLPYGEEFRKHRKWIQDAVMDKSALLSYEPLQRKETVTLLIGLIETPEAFMTHIKRFSAAIILRITYGHSVTSTDDELAELINCIAEGVIQFGGGSSSLVDFFPILKNIPTWFPGAGFKRHALKMRDLMWDLQLKLFGIVQAQLAEGKAKQSIVAHLIENACQQNTIQQEKEHIMAVGTTMYLAGTDTTNAVLSTFLLAMVLYPSVYRKAQEEIERTIGHERLPDLRDIPSLSYLKCVLKETYRWNCPLPLSIAHRLMEDDEYRGYHIPKGSVVIPNLWNITQDAELYPQPEIFRPERFQGIDASAPDPGDIIFGQGRRICPGSQLAESNILLVMASIIAIFDVRAPKDEFGVTVFPMPKFSTSTFVSHPLDFACVITPRSKTRVELVTQINSSMS